jgi:hypothetical protein
MRLIAPHITGFNFAQGIQKSSEIGFKIKSNHLPKI